MKIAYIDCMFGVSGDMMLGALTACGLPIEKLSEELGKLHVHGFEINAEQVIHSGITAIHVNVHTEHQHEHRHLSHIKNIIESSSLSERVKTDAVKIFTRLAEAEARVHGTTPEKIHFHEVGALDAIVDVVGTCIGFEWFGVEKIISTPIHFGTGTVKCAHGILPVPVPAVVELTKGFPVVRTTIDGEITTPTGAAIITSLASSFGPSESMVIETSGYGAGTKIRENMPNVLRLSIGNETGSYDKDNVTVIETNIDDMSPEIFGYVSEKLMREGAKDVYMTPVFMKKNRPGILLTVVSDDISSGKLTDIILRETTTIGVRIHYASRKKLPRNQITVQTEYGPVRVKTVSVNNGTRFTPEYDDCAKIASEKSIPILEIYEAAQKASLK